MMLGEENFHAMIEIVVEHTMNAKGGGDEHGRTEGQILLRLPDRALLLSHSPDPGEPKNARFIMCEKWQRGNSITTGNGRRYFLIRHFCWESVYFINSAAVHALPARPLVASRWCLKTASGTAAAWLVQVLRM